MRTGHAVGLSQDRCGGPGSDRRVRRQVIVKPFVRKV